MRKGRRILALALTFIMIAGMLPESVYAYNATGGGTDSNDRVTAADSSYLDADNSEVPGHVCEDECVHGAVFNGKCECGDCAHDDCDCEDHYGENHSCTCGDCSGHADKDGVTPDGAAIEGTAILSAEYNYMSDRVACTMSSTYLYENPNFSSITYSFFTDYDNGNGLEPRNIEGKTYWYLDGNWAELTRTGDYTASFIAMSGSEMRDVAPQMLEGKVYIKIEGDNMGSPFQISYDVSTSPDLASDLMQISRNPGEELTRDEIDTVKLYIDSNYYVGYHFLKEGYNYTKTVTTETDSNKQEWWVVKYTAITGRAQNEKTVKFKKAGESETLTITVNYVVPSGYTKPESQTKTGAKGETYSFTSPTIAGLTPDKTVVSGTIGDADETITVTYTEETPGTGKDLSTAKVVGLNEDKDHKYTEEEAKRIGLEDESGKPIVEGKEYVRKVTEITDEDDSWKWKWLIESEPIEGKSKGKKTIEVSRPDPSKPKHNVTVHYIYKLEWSDEASRIAAPTVVRSYYEGEGFTIMSPKVPIPTSTGNGRYCMPSASFVHGTMGTTDQEYTVTYTYGEIMADEPYQVEVFYKVEAKEGVTPPTPPEDVKIRPLNNGDPYSITSYPYLYDENYGLYYPDIEVVSGRIENYNVTATVTYKPSYNVSIYYRLPGRDGYTCLLSEWGPDGAAYKYDVGSLLADKVFGGDHDKADYWTITPSEVSGTIQGEDVRVNVDVTCSHPISHIYILEGNNETHDLYCDLCKKLVKEEAHSFDTPVFMTPDELVKIDAFFSLEEAQEVWPAGAMAKICTECGKALLSSPDEDYCPARPAEEKAKHLWSSWEKVNDTQCSRTCARCKKTVTVSHAWGEWEYCTSKTHTRRCRLCKCTQTGDHGVWSNATVHKQATCIADAEVGATCGICDKHINNVYYGIVGSINPEYVRKGHDFTGGYARINGGHTQKCKVCGAYDMEHVENHAWGEWYATEGGDSCTGTRKMRRECPCGAYETKTEENSHNYVRDPAREIGVTCESPGTECYTCTKCGGHNDREMVALGHAWVEDEGNYPAECGKEGRMWWHCANPGCTATKKDDCPAPSDHDWGPYWISKPTCTREGKKAGEICSYCGKRRNESDYEITPKLNHDLATTKTLKRSGTYVSRTGNAAIDEEVWVVTNRCKTCGYNFPEAVYTVAKSSNLSRYKIEPGDVRVNEIGDGIHVSGQFGKANAVYFNNTVNGAFKEVVDNLLNIYRQKEGSVITEFKPEFMNSLADGEYEMIHVNGDELSAATLTVKDHKFVPTDGKLPGIKALDESGVITSEPDPDLSEKIVVNGQEVDYYPWMADGEMLFYLGQIEDNAAAVNVPDMGEGYTALTAHADPCVTPGKVDFDRREGSTGNADVVVVKSDKGHTFDSAHPISLFGVNVPETEEVEPEEGAEKITRTNYVIAGDKVTFKKEYLESLGEGEHTFLLNYTDGTQPGQVTVNIKGIAEVVEETDKQESWNLFEDASEHAYRVSGVSSAKEAANLNKTSSKYFTATLTRDVITVKLKDGADRKKAAAANTFDFDLGEEGTVSYNLPLTYNKPTLKLSSTKGTVKKGKTTVLSTRVYIQTENGNYVPFELDGATVTYGTNTVSTRDNGLVKITASGKTSGKIKITKNGWNEKDPVTLKYTIAEVKATKDVLAVDLGGLKQVVLNVNAPEQSFTFPLTLNGEDATPSTVTIDEKKKGAALGSIGNGTLTVSIGRSGVKAGTYTLNLKGGNAALKVKVKVSGKALNKSVSLKVKQKYDVVTKKPMVIVPTFKAVGGKITDVSVVSPAEFAAELDGGNINLTYTGENEMKASNLNIGTVKLALTIEGIKDPVEFTLNKVKAKKTLPKVKAAKVTIPKNAKNDGTVVIGTANILSTYTDSAKHKRIIKPVDVTLKCKKVTAEVDPDNKNRILIKKLDGKSGNVKATLTYPGGITKTVTISVAKGK